MGAKAWKVTAIIFILLFLIETALVVWIFSVGINEINQETECQINVCNKPEYTAYEFDTVDNMCYCYIEDEVAYKEFIK